MFTLSRQQQEVVDSDARVKFVMGGQRSGKTTVLLECLGKEMKALNSPDTRVIIYEISDTSSRFMMREVWKYFGNDNIFRRVQGENSIEIITIDYGTIEIKQFENVDYVNADYDIVAVDGASRNKYLRDILDKHAYSCNRNGLTKMIIAGHCPEDANNDFYKEWCKAFYGDKENTKAFKLIAWDNPQMARKKEQWEKEIMPNMSLERYVRDYYATII